MIWIAIVENLVFDECETAVGSLKTGQFRPEAKLERRALLYGEALAPVRRIGVRCSLSTQELFISGAEINSIKTTTTLFRQIFRSFGTAKPKLYASEATTQRSPIPVDSQTSLWRRQHNPDPVWGLRIEIPNFPKLPHHPKVGVGFILAADIAPQLS